MVFHRKTNFSHVKRWFWSGLPQENHLFTREKLVFGSKTIIFTRSKLVFVAKTIFLRGLRWFSYEEQSFFEVNQKNNLFQNPPPFSKKDCFFGSWFCLVKDGFA